MMGRNEIIRSRNDELDNKGAAIQNKSVEVFQTINEKLGHITHSARGAEQADLVSNEKVRDAHNSSNISNFEKAMIPEEASDRNPSDNRKDDSSSYIRSDGNVREVTVASQDKNAQKVQFDNTHRMEQENRVREANEKARRDSVMNSIAAQKAAYAYKKACAIAEAQERASAAQEYRR